MFHTEIFHLPFITERPVPLDSPLYKFSCLCNGIPAIGHVLFTASRASMVHVLSSELSPTLRKLGPTTLQIDYTWYPTIVSFARPAEERNCSSRGDLQLLPGRLHGMLVGNDFSRPTMSHFLKCLMKCGMIALSGRSCSRTRWVLKDCYERGEDLHNRALMKH